MEKYKEVKIEVEACPMCDTRAYVAKVLMTKDEIENDKGWHKCSSGFGMWGGGPCCSSVKHKIKEMV